VTRAVPAGLSGAAIARIFREESGRSVACLIRVVGDFSLAEDAVQEAFAIALERWPRDGLPPNPGRDAESSDRDRRGTRPRRRARPSRRVGACRRTRSPSRTIARVAPERLR
jgi:RNA polymerase sigma-70 factor (ECF subfamily)